MSKTERLIHVGAVLTLGAPTLMAGDPRRSPEKLLVAFSRDWDELGWTQKSERRPHGYIRALNDRGWRTRMVALQDLMSHDKSAVPVLVETVKNGGTPNHILTAQALGYLAPHVPYRTLLEAAKTTRTRPFSCMPLVRWECEGSHSATSTGMNFEKPNGTAALGNISSTRLIERIGQSKRTLSRS